MDMCSKYEIRQQIGKGSFGNAFLVTNKQDKKDYVLKRVRLAKQTKWQRSSTLQERDLVTTLQHPFIVPCIETWTVQGHTVNMIYGLCEKGDLASYLQRIQKLTSQVDEGQMVKWLCQLLLALDYLQTNKVLHRDIKTSNLMLTCDMDVQIGDFGLATRMQDAGEGSKPQDTNLVGTPHYMSPELLSCKDYGFKTDVWSLGCVFYELTAQRPTFNAFNIHGLVSKIKKNKLAPLPDWYSSEWREVVGMMLIKDPEKRPSVQELLALPCLRPGVLQARKRAQHLMPAVQLPPLLDPTPFVVRQTLSRGQRGSQDGDSDASATDAEAVAADALDAVPAGRGDELSDSSNNSTWAASALATHALCESELSEVWRVNSLQRNSSLHTIEQQQPLNDQQLEPAPVKQLNSHLAQGDPLQQQSQGSSRDMQLVDTFSSRCSDSSRASSCSPGSLKQQLVTRSGANSAVRVVHQPGIRSTQSERVAAAIAAAKSRAAAVATADTQVPLGTAAPPLGPAADNRRISPADTSKDGSTRTSSRDCGSSINSKAATTPTQPQQEAAAALSAKLALYREAKATSAGGQKVCSRPNSAKGMVRSSPRPAWNSPAVAGTAHQRPSSGRAAGPASTVKAAASAVVGSAKAGDAVQFNISVLPQPQHSGDQRTGGMYLQSLEVKQQQQCQAVEDNADNAQQLLSKSQRLIFRAIKLHQGVQPETQTESAQPEQLPAAGASPLPQQEEGEHTYGADNVSDSETEDSDLAVKQLRFDSTSPAHSSRASRTPMLGALAAASGSASNPGGPGPAMSDMFAAATAARGLSKGRYSKDAGTGLSPAVGDSPVLSGSMAASKPVGAAAVAAELQPEPEQPPPEGNAHSISASPADSSNILHSSMCHAGVFEGIESHSSMPPRNTAAVSAAAISASDRQRLELLESVLLVVGSLYSTGRWQELGNVLASADLLPDGMQAAIHSAALQGPPTCPAAAPAVQGFRHNTSGSCARSHIPSDIVESSPGQQRSALKLGDVVVLGRNRRVKGKIRYIGPVAWDLSGQIWVGMELETPCGMNGTQKGITYFDCPPKCATFHRASQLSSYHGA